MAEGLSIMLPLVLDKEAGPYKMNKTLEDVAEQNLKMIVLTSPGERVMNPAFGVGIRNYLFELDSPFAVSDIQTRIKSQVRSYAPYIGLKKVDINIDSDNGTLFVRINYRLPNRTTVSELVVTVST